MTGNILVFENKLSPRGLAIKVSADVQIENDFSYLARISTWQRLTQEDHRDQAEPFHRFVSDEAEHLWNRLVSVHLTISMRSPYIENIIREVIARHKILIQRCKHRVHVVCKAK
jgi:hypothetical protein